MHWCVADLVSGYDEIILEISFVRPLFQNHLVFTLCNYEKQDLDLD